MTVQDPVNNKMVFTENLAPINLTSTGSNIKQYYDSSGNLLQTVQTDFNAAVSPLEWAPDLNNQLRVVDGYLPIRVTTTLNPSNQVKKVETDWDSVSVTQGNGTVTTISIQNPLETREYDFGSGSPGPLLRRTTDTYLHQNNSTYLAKNLLSLKSSEIIHDGSGKLVAQTLYTYDSTPLISTTGAPNHDYTNYSTSNTVRGNLTQVQRWRNTDGAWLSTTYTYDDLGNLRSMTDPCGNTTCSDMSGANHTTTYSYSDNWANSSCVPSSTNTYGYLTLTTDPLGHRLQKGYFPCTGLTHQMQDENDLKASRSGLLTSYDYMGRTTEIDYPDGGQTKFAYSGSSLPYTVTTTRKINSTQSLISQTINDGLGRAVETQLTSDPQGTVYTDTTYDTLGRVSSLSNPYRKGSDITSTPGITTYGYDGLGRKVTEIYPDGSVLTTAYCGASTLVTDPTKRWRRSRVDGLGRLVEVDEPNAIGASVASTGCPGTGEPIWVTSYTLDALGNLTNVVQNGSHQRSFTYDSLSKLLTSSNPEVGTITYTYDADGNTATKKDARNIITTYGYDVLNREISRSYSNGDPTVSIAYDQAACLGLSSCDNVGHRTSGADAAGSELWSYQIDTNHQQSIHKEQRTTSGISKITTYVLDLAGNTTQVTYPTFQIVNYTFDSANRPSAVQDASNGITYATGPKTSPGGTCANNVTCYTPQGTVYAVSIGQTASFAGLDITNSYSYRLQPNEFKASSVGGNAIDITYSFVDPATLKNAGHVYSITNNLNSSRTQSFTYDQVNRILSAGTSATTGTYCWGYQYSYDAWGNLTSQAGWTPNYTGCTQTVWPGAPADGNNHLSNFGYDFSGNTTGDGYYTYAWNAESQVKTAGGVTYTYDGDGRRASKVGSKLYWYDARSEILGETDASGNTLNEYIFFGAKRIAMLPAGGTVQYYVEDSLGSSRIVSTNTGVVCYDADFSPYGGERQVIDSCTQNNYKFEGKERDTETGNDDFGARYYTWRFGRWLSADWSTVPIAVPYANLTNPQTLNLYAMVADDPVSFADLEGHQQAEPPDVEPERDENEERPDIEPWNRAGAAIAERAAMERELAQAEFEANHPNGYDNPLTGICYAPRVVPREKEGEVYVTDPQQKSGKPYVGRTTQGTDTRMKTRTDGRTGKAEVVDTYKTAEEGQYKEQKAMDNRGGKANLDNRRREVNSQRMKELEKKYAPSKPKLPLSEPFIPPTPPKFPEDDF
jgi:RHS repeat-associated protein